MKGKVVSVLRQTKRKTMIISAFAGCGKTALARHQQLHGLSILDLDSSQYKKVAGWEADYADDILNAAISGRYDFVLICQTESVLTELDMRGIRYVIVEPDNLVWDTQPETPERKRERQLIKQQWFGRLVLRDNSHINDLQGFVTYLDRIYELRTGKDFLACHRQVAFFPLKENQYLSDIIPELYWKKETYEIYWKQKGIGDRNEQ